MDKTIPLFPALIIILLSIVIGIEIGYHIWGV